MTAVKLSQRLAWVERGGQQIPSPKLVRDMLAWLGDERMIELSMSGAGSARQFEVTITNWAAYQDGEDAPTLRERGKPRKKPYIPTEKALQCLKRWEEGRALPKNPDGSLMQAREEYCKPFDQLVNIDKLTWKQVGQIVMHATTQWGPEHIQSPAKLRSKGSTRSKYPGQYTWQTIWLQIGANHKEHEFEYTFPEQEWKKNL